MLRAMLYFFGMAGFLVAGSVCFSIFRLLKVHGVISSIDDNPAWSGTRKWDEMKATLIVWYTRCQEREAANRRAILSWARTFALCAALCVIGVCLEVQFDQTITFSRIIAGFQQLHAVSTVAQPAQSSPHNGEPVPLAD